MRKNGRERKRERNIDRGIREGDNGSKIKKWKVLKGEEERKEKK